MLKKYLIVANGPFLFKSIILEAALDAIIVALDGAADKLALLNIKPNIILGDLDSINQSKEKWGIHKDFYESEYETNTLFSLPCIGHDGVSIIWAKNQQFTDLQKALKFIIHHAAQNGFPPPSLIHIVCALSGRMDHEQTNIRALQDEYIENCPIYLHNEYQTMQYISDQTVTLKGKKGDYCGLFGMPAATMIVKNAGLKYGNNEPYALFPSQYSAANSLLKEEGAVVEIKGQALVIHPPMFEAQRKFSQKTRKEQLEELLKDQR